MTNTWNPIIVDAGIFTEMVHKYGCYDVTVQFISSNKELNMLSEDSTYGIIIGYPCLDSYSPELSRNNEIKDTENINFVPELIQYSTGTVAVLNIITNLSFKKVRFLQNLLDSPTGVTSKNLGQALLNMPDFKKLQDEANDIFNMTSMLNSDDVLIPTKHNLSERGKTYHFISYIYKDDYIWKLDGRQNSAIKIRHVGKNEKWIEVLKEVTKEQIEFNDLCSSYTFAFVADPSANSLSRKFVNKVAGLFFSE